MYIKVCRYGRHTPYAAMNDLCMSQNIGVRYDFYASPPGTRAEIRAWLTSQLSAAPLPDAQIRKEIDGDVWVVEHGNCKKKVPPAPVTGTKYGT